MTVRKNMETITKKNIPMYYLEAKQVVTSNMSTHVTIEGMLTWLSIGKC